MQEPIEPQQRSNAAARAETHLPDTLKALSTADEQALEQLTRAAPDREQFQEILHKAVSRRSFWMAPFPKAQSMEVHAALWMLPIVVREHCLPPQTNGPLLAKWVGECIGAPLVSSTISILPSMSALHALTPIEVFTLLNALCWDRPKDPASLSSPRFETPHFLPGVPTLQFMVGAVQSLQGPCVFPMTCDFQRNALLVHGLWVQSPDGLMHASDDMSIGAPVPFGLAMAHGILLWLHQVERLWSIQHWYLEPMERDTITLCFLLKRRENGELRTLEHAIKLWQVGLTGLAEIAQRCTTWPMAMPSHQRHAM